MSDTFQFTRPAWGATLHPLHSLTHELFQFTRPAWGATATGSILHSDPSVSIHAPRVGRDHRNGILRLP